MIQASKLIALQTPGLFMPQTWCRPALIHGGQDHRDACVYLRYRHRRRPCVSPAALPSPATMWRVTTAFGDEATPANDGPPRPLTPLHSCGAGGMLRGDVRLWPHGPTAPAVSQARRWTEKTRPAPPVAGRGRGRVARLTVPQRLVAAAASASPHVVWPRRPPAALWSRRARRSAARRPLQARHSPPRRVARAASGDGPRPLDAGGAVSTSRLNVLPGTASLERSPQPWSRRRNQDGRPIASSPALHPCGSRLPLACNMANAHGCRERYPRWAVGTPALSRRAVAVVQALGRYRRLSTSVWPSPDTSPRETATGPLSTWPSRPHPWRATPTDAVPAVGKPEGANPRTPSACPKGAATWPANSGRTGTSSPGAQPRKRGRGRRSCPKRYAIDAIFLRSTSESRPQIEVWACWARSGRQKVATKGALKVVKRGSPWSKIAGATWHSASNGCFRVAYRAASLRLLPCIAYGHRMHGGHLYKKT